MFFDLFFFVLAFFMSIPLVGAWYASSRGKDFWTWYFIGLFLPIISFVILLCLPDKKNPVENELEQIRIQNKMLGLKNEVPNNNGKFLKWLKRPINTISFEIIEDDEDKRIHALIDHKPLMDLLSEQDIKKQRFRIKKKPLIAYTGLAPELILPPSKHLLGKPISNLPKRTLVMREVNSDKLILVKVEMLRRHVIWHEFVKVEGTIKVSAYPKTGPFVFDRWQYELALNDVSYRYKKIV